MKKTKKNQAGFTLIELAIIIAVLGILGAVGAVKFADMTQEAQRAAESSALANARSALAIATVKKAPDKVMAADLTTYLDGFNATTMQIDGKVQLVFNNDHATAGIITVATGSITP